MDSPDAETLANFRMVTLQLSKRDGHVSAFSISQHWGYFDSEDEAVGAAVRKIPDIKPGFSVDAHLVASPFATTAESGEEKQNG